MKKIIICLLISAFGYTVHAQRFNRFNRFDSDWKLGVGVNAVGNLGTRNPVEKLGDYAIKHPIMVSIERQWTRDFALEQDISLNGFDSGVFLDNGIPSENLTYFSTNTNFKWYFNDYLFDADWVDLYAQAGLGIFYMDELNTSANLSGGVIFWFSENVGVKLQATGKLALNANNRQYANNHWQHALQLMFRL